MERERENMPTPRPTPSVPFTMHASPGRGHTSQPLNTTRVAMSSRCQYRMVIPLSREYGTCKPVLARVWARLDG